MGRRSRRPSRPDAPRPRSGPTARRSTHPAPPTQPTTPHAGTIGNRHPATILITQPAPRSPRIGRAHPEPDITTYHRREWIPPWPFGRLAGTVLGPNRRSQECAQAVFVEGYAIVRSRAV